MLTQIYDKAQWVDEQICWCFEQLKADLSSDDGFYCIIELKMG